MKKKKERLVIPIRMNILFFIVFALFSVLIARLSIVQILYGDDYVREIERTENITVSNSVPRGKILDSTMETIVDNIPIDAITYTRNKGVKTKDMLTTASELSEYIKKDTKKISERDRKDFWLLTHEKEALAKVSKQELKDLKDKEIYKLQLERITEEEMNSFSEQELEVLAIYREFSNSMELTPQIVKNEEVTSEEFAIVSEHLDELPGVGVTTDWNRNYTYPETLRNVIGNISSSEKGLPSEQLDYYLARGYSRNDRVGTSYLEKQYEDVLQGQKEKVKNITQQGKVVETIQVSEGQRGKDLVLTIDMDLQLAVEAIIEKELKASIGTYNTKFLDRAFVVLMDPRTGEILTMAGKKNTKNEETGNMEIKDFSIGTINTSYSMGSTVKGATVLTGYLTGAITPGTMFYDTTMILGGGLKKSSASKHIGLVDERDALKKSSNVYMFQTAIKIGKGTYTPGRSPKLTDDAFTVMRNHYAQFGLGVKTGIDLPGESAGFKGSGTIPGLLLDFSIGQYDTYTPMQLAQYISTIANGGKRMKPHLVKEIREPVNEVDTIGPVFQEITPTVLNQLDLQPGWIERVQEGFRRVAQDSGGTAAKFLANKSYKPAAKTGTAEAFYDGPTRVDGSLPVPTTNLTLVGYAPYNNPEVAMAVIVPWAYQSTSTNINKLIGSQVLDAYFNLKNGKVEATQSDEESE